MAVLELLIFGQQSQKNVDENGKMTVDKNVDRICELASPRPSMTVHGSPF